MSHFLKERIPVKTKEDQIKAVATDTTPDWTCPLKGGMDGTNYHCNIECVCFEPAEDGPDDGPPSYYPSHCGNAFFSGGSGLCVEHALPAELKTAKA